MSRVPYTIDVNRYVCSELDEIRTMVKTLDFSGLLACVERIQHHATAMEDALYSGKDFKDNVKSHLKDYEGNPDEFLRLVKGELS